MPAIILKPATLKSMPLKPAIRIALPILPHLDPDTIAEIPIVVPVVEAIVLEARVANFLAPAAEIVRLGKAGDHAGKAQRQGSCGK